VGKQMFRDGDTRRSQVRDSSLHVDRVPVYDRRASLPEVQATLGHGNISTTSGYLHARPDSSSGLRRDPGVFLR
jgi:hypothetical protein